MTSDTWASPIDLGGALPGNPGTLLFGYEDAVIEGRDVGTTLEFSVPAQSRIDCGERRYELVEFHFHTPSEHAVDGEYAPIEAHLVHEDREGNICIVAVFGEERETSHWPRKLSEPLQLRWMLPGSTTRFAYSGSLTTPPYDEPVAWSVFPGRLPINPEWVHRFRARYGPNSRTLQPLNGRGVIVG